MATIDLRCANCAARLRVPLDIARRKKIRCPRCDNIFIIPKEELEPSPSVESPLHEAVVSAQPALPETAATEEDLYAEVAPSQELLPVVGQDESDDEVEYGTPTANYRGEKYLAEDELAPVVESKEEVAEPIRTRKAKQPKSQLSTSAADEAATRAKPKRRRRSRQWLAWMILVALLTTGTAYTAWLAWRSQETEESRVPASTLKALTPTTHSPAPMTIKGKARVPATRMKIAPASKPVTPRD